MHEEVIIAITMISICLILGMTINGIVDKLVTAKRLRHAPPPEGDNGAQMRAVTERQQQIEERLRVLERIATDRGSVLADEIEALRRDTPALAARQPEVTAQ